MNLLVIMSGLYKSSVGIAAQGRDTSHLKPLRLGEPEGKDGGREDEYAAFTGMAVAEGSNETHKGRSGSKMYQHIWIDKGKRKGWRKDGWRDG